MTEEEEFKIGLRQLTSNQHLDNFGLYITHPLANQTARSQMNGAINSMAQTLSV